MSDVPVLAVDIGGSHVSGGVVHGGEYLEVLDLRRAPHSPVPDLERFVADLVAATVDHRPSALGIALAGVVDDAHRRVVASENLGDVPRDLAPWLEAAVGLPTFIDTDVFCLGRAVGAQHPTEDVLVVAVGTGIGHCVVLKGRVRVGRGRHANRFGHITVVPDGRSCYCGQKGCACQYVAGEALRRLLESDDGHADAHDLLGRALAPAVQVLCPDRVVLAGGPVMAGAIQPDPLGEATSAYCEPWMVPPLSALVDESAIYQGAALLAREHLAPS